MEFGYGETEDEGDFEPLGQLPTLNNHTAPDFDGWSWTNDVYGADTDTGKYFKIRIRSNGFTDNFEVPFAEQPLKLGSLLVGDKYVFPQNADLRTSLDYNYGIKRTKTIAGKTLSKSNWSKPNNWVSGEPFGLNLPYYPDAYYDHNNNNFLRRTGVRTWKISFDSLGPEKLMNQNPMLNGIGFQSQDTTNDNVSGIDNISLDNIIGPRETEGHDMFNKIVHRSMGGHLQMILQLDKDNHSPHSFAIVRMQPNYKITQKAPNLYNIKLTLEEQV